MPIREIAALARSRGALCVVDGAQALGHVPVDVRALGCDAYAACGHKWLLGPKGTGLLYISKAAEDRIQPVQREDGRRVRGAFDRHRQPAVDCRPRRGDRGRADARRGGHRTPHPGAADRAYAGMQAIPKLTMASPPSDRSVPASSRARVPDAAIRATSCATACATGIA